MRKKKKRKRHRCWNSCGEWLSKIVICPRVVELNRPGFRAKVLVWRTNNKWLKYGTSDTRGWYEHTSPCSYSEENWRDVHRKIEKVYVILLRSLSVALLILFLCLEIKWTLTLLHTQYSSILTRYGVLYSNIFIMFVQNYIRIILTLLMKSSPQPLLFFFILA